MAVTNYTKVASILGDKLPVAAHVGMLLMQRKHTEAVELYESIAADLAGMPVPEVKPQRKKKLEALPADTLDSLFGTDSKKPEPKKGKFTAAEGFKATLKFEKQKLQEDK